MVSWVDIVPTLIDLVGGTFPADIDGKSGSHRDRIFTTHTGDGKMNIFPIRSVGSVRTSTFTTCAPMRSIPIIPTNTERTARGHTGTLGTWLQEQEKNAADIIRRYYTRDEFELFDLSKDPYELVNLADRPEHRSTLEKMRHDLSVWTTSQGDELEAHQEPYLTSKPIPIIKPSPRKRSSSKYF